MQDPDLRAYSRDSHSSTGHQMESIKSRVKAKISLMFERSDSTDSESGSDDEDEEEEYNRRKKYNSLPPKPVQDTLAVGSYPHYVPSPPLVVGTPHASPASRKSPPPSAADMTASRALNFFRRKSDPRGSNQSRERAEKAMRRELHAPLIVHRRRSSIAMTK